jgi:ankyrin repeat protein
MNDGNLTSALHEAVAQGDPDLIRLLCGAGAKVNFGNSKGMTALFCATQRNDDLEEACCDALIEAGATQMRVPPGRTKWRTKSQFASFVI